MFPDWTCPACGLTERVRPASWIRDLMYRYAHQKRCATAEGYVPSEKTVREAWRALGGRGAPPWIHFSTLNGAGHYGQAILSPAGKKVCAVSLRCAPGITMGTMLHEMCHFAVGFNQHRGHDETFNGALRVAVHRLWGLSLNHLEDACGMAMSYRIDLHLVQHTPGK